MAAIAVAAASVLAVLLPALWVSIGRLRAPRLPVVEAERPTAAVVTILLPVRNEASNIVACLASLEAQTVPVRVLVLDDGSTDDTLALASAVAGAVASGVAEADSRVRVLRVPSPPDGVSGKVHALEFGEAQSESESGVVPGWILSIDADARLAPEAVGRAVRAAELHGLSALSLAARQRSASLGDALLTPLVFALLDALLGDWHAAARGGGDAVANGQFILVDRAALIQAGGFSALRSAMLDDVAMARLLRASGYRTGFWRAREHLSVRMYHGFGAAFEGWCRNLGLYIGNRAWLIAGATTIALTPVVATLILVIHAAATGSSYMPALVAWCAGTTASVIARVDSGSSPWVGLLYPLDAIAFSACLITAYRDRTRGRSRNWRGRQVRLGDG